MASNGVSATPPVGVVQLNVTPQSSASPAGNGKPLPQVGNNQQSAQAAAPAPQGKLTTIQALVAQLNKYLNDSGQPDQFRADPSAPDRLIQQINPANGEVIGEFSSAEFPALARSLGLTGGLVDSKA